MKISKEKKIKAIKKTMREQCEILLDLEPHKADVIVFLEQLKVMATGDFIREVMEIHQALQSMESELKRE
ncbi:MAG: hypothetical protein NTX92_02495 [Euryarchaeota archaeon]|nr:hypothetical protein [Euryarchaeota archaeon]